MRILHTVAGLWEGTGGPVASVTALCSTLAARGHDVTLLTGEGPLHPAVRDLRPRVHVRTERLGPYRAAHWSPAYGRACLEEARRADLVHDHGVWLYTNWTAVGMGGRAGRPVVRSPRGMLSPWALRRSRLVKRILWHGLEKRLFERSNLIHATSVLEQAEVEALGIQAPTVVIPNGVDLEGEYAGHRVADARDAGFAETEGRRAAVFLSRIHPKKGLDLLCQAWGELPATSPAVLLIAGPGEDRAIAELRRWLATQPGPPARYLGPVTGSRKLSLLASAWFVALPSHSENYGMVVAEALACGTPVLASTEMPWEELGRSGCGWVVAPDSNSIAPALRHALGLSAGEHEAMRTAARSFVERAHSLAETAGRMEAAYEHVLAGRLRALGTAE